MNSKRPSFVQSLLTFIFGLYGLLLVVYFILRLLLSDSEWWLALLHNAAPYFFIPVIVGVVLALLMRALRLFGLYSVLAVIGAVWIGVDLWPATPPPPTGSQVTILSFNLYPYNERLEDAMDYILAKDADLVLLQDMPDELDHSRLSQAYDLEIVGEQHAIFSRIDLSFATEFTLGGIPMQRVVMNVDGEPYALYNVHLLMPLDTENEDAPLLQRYDETQRNAQIDELIARLDNERLPFVVVGDFNTSEYSPAYDRLDAIMTDAYRASSWGIGATWPAGEFEEASLPAWFPRLFRLDYVWYSDDIQAVSATVGPRLGSDHLPLLVTLDLNP